MGNEGSSPGYGGHEKATQVRYGLYHGYQIMDCGMILLKLCSCFEHISLTFEKNSDSLGEATQLESRETLYCKENNMELCPQQLFSKLGNCK